MVGLPTPLHLAASLLALAAAVGLSMVLFADLGGRENGFAALLRRRVGAGGALVYAGGHVVTGSLDARLAELGAWLQAAGLVGLAIGLCATSAPFLRGSAVLIPVPDLPPSLVGAAAAGIAALRLAFTGSRGFLAAFGLVGLAAGQGLGPDAPVWSAVAEVVGAVLLGAWIRQRAGGSVLVKVTTSFVAVLLVLALLIAGVLSSVGTADLVREELDRLEGLAQQLTGEVERWPRDAIDAAEPVSLLYQQLVQPNPADYNAFLYQFGLSDQDFLLVLDAAGTEVNRHPQDLPPELVTAVTSTAAAARVRQGVDVEGGGILATGGRLVGFGAVPVYASREASFPGVSPPVGVLLTGRIADADWLEAVAVERRQPVALEVAGELTVGSGTLPLPLEELDAALGRRESAALEVEGGTFYAGADPIIDQVTDEALGAVVVVGDADSQAITDLERRQASRLFLVTLVSAALAGIASALVARRLVRPIRRLTVAAERVRSGDLEVKAAVDTADEIGQLGRTFNAMTESLAGQSTQLRDAAAVQRRLRARLEALTSSMSDGLIAVDLDGRVIAYNPAASIIVGRTADEVLRRPLRDTLFGRLERGTGHAVADPVAALGAPNAEEAAAETVLLERPEGGVAPTAITASPVRDADGHVLGRVYVLRDVTREAEIERMKSEFLSNVSHELRTPLTPIKGYANVLARRDVGPEATKSFAGEILAATDRLERIVGLIVDFAALDSGRLQLRREDVDLRSLVDEALADWTRRHADREFRCDLNGSLPRVSVDRPMLRRCLDELLDNAVKFSPGGEPVAVAATAVPSSRTVRLSVLDRGVGIEPDVAARIFADFYQVDATETRHFGGLGLGLALVRRIVEGMGAEAQVQSDGDGTAVHLVLPMADAAPAVPQPPPAFAQVPRP